MLVKKFILTVLVLAAVYSRLDAKKGGRRGHSHRRDHERRGGGRSHERNADIEYTPPFSGQRIRFGGNVSDILTQGNIEVYVRNRWGPICDDEWDKMDANVACKQLGFERGAGNLTTKSTFGKGPWQGSDILMDDINCNGNEHTLQNCDYEATSNCASTEFAGVSCLYNTGCPDGWLAGPTGCYYLSNITTSQKKFAVNKCANMGGHLVNIETEAENHFLSAVFANIPGEPIITGATKNRDHWMWERVVRSSSSSRSRRAPPGRRGGFYSRSSSTHTSTYESTVQVSIHYFKWFPGWLPGNKKPQPDGKKADKCLYLTSVFAHPEKSRGDVEVDYLYWDDNVCARKKKKMKNGFRYMCEREREEIAADEKSQDTEQACYVDNGTTYRGTHANTERGTPCINWADSKKHTPDRFPDKGLEGHNYCRNPDADTKPWCYVNDEGKFGYCPIPQCTDSSDTQTAVTEAPVYTTTTSSPDCPDDQFFCSRSSTCIGQQWRCDYEPDCEFGEDEEDCDYQIGQFQVVPYRTLSDSVVIETYMGASNETCAKFCLASKVFTCRSFSFYPSERKCQLSSENNQTSLYLYQWKYNSNVYILNSQTSTCDGMHTCDNGKCVTMSVVCNMVDDCGDSSDEKQCGFNSTSVEVRLVGGDDEQSGRVEVKYLGKWGVICDDKWDNDDAAVICKMLGYNGASATAVTHSKYGSGNGDFFLDEVKCVGIEDSITDCEHDGWKVHDCHRHEVAGVMCKAQKACTSGQYACSNGMCLEASSVCDGVCQCQPDCQDENGDGQHDCSTASLHLVDGPDRSSGRVEIVRNGLRGTVCDDSWDDVDATVVCKTAGYRYGTAVTGGGFGKGTGAIWLDDVECSGSEASLVNCRMSGWGVSNCDHSEDAGVICSDTAPTADDDSTPVSTDKVTVELVDGPTSSSGRVEIIYRGERGTICDDSWDDSDATVICKMLGYTYGRAQIEGYYGPGSDSIRILLDDVECGVTESTISQCGHSGWGNSNCAHGEDAGVDCYMEGQEDVDTSLADTNDDELSAFTCGLRPLEMKARKKREEPREEKELALPPKFERIIGGFTAAKGFYPWQVGVRRYIQDGIYSHWCGGTILSPNWILSAAHCFVDIPKGLIVVRTGDHDNKVDDDYEQEFELEQLINHHLYDEDTFDYDIALLKISPLYGSGIKFNDHVQPACLPDETDEYVTGQKCHVSGWGKTEHGYQNLLKSARVPLIDDVKCRSLYKDITDQMFCAGYLAGGIDTCSGDSGGPLVCEINGRYTVMGATSFGADCAQANAPGVYAKVSEFLPWIKSTIRQYS